MTYELIEVRTEAGKVGIITLNRPKQLNALNDGPSTRTCTRSVALRPPSSVTVTRNVSVPPCAGAMNVGVTPPALASDTDTPVNWTQRYCAMLAGAAAVEAAALNVTTAFGSAS